MKALTSSAIFLLCMAHRALNRVWLFSGTSTVRRLVGPAGSDAGGSSETHLSACGDTAAWGRAVIAIFLLIISLHEFCCECLNPKRGGAASIRAGNGFPCGEAPGKTHARGY